MPDNQTDPAKRAWLNQPINARTPQSEAIRRHVVARRSAVRKQLVAAALVLAGIIVWFAMSAFFAHDSYVRAGYGLLAVGMCVALARLKWIWPGELSEGAPAETWIGFQRSNLRRRRQSLLNRVLWGLGPMLPGVATLIYGVFRPRPEAFGPVAVLLVLWGAAWIIMQLRSTAQLDRELNELQKIGES